MINKNDLCPCCSGKEYQECCYPIIYTSKSPDTPEELMRSRYTAYALLNMGYIAKTMRGKANKGFDKHASFISAKKVFWQKLEIINISQKSHTQGYVEFKAYYSENNSDSLLHEKSEFQRKLGKWYYVDGQIVQE